MSGLGMEIAIVGLAIRCPGASTEAEFWHNLMTGVESLETFPPDEVDLPDAMRRLGSGAVHVPAGGLLAGATRFDAARFGFSAREAQVTDPQQRQFLEVATEAFDNAGIDPAGTVTGVFAGASFPSYLLSHVWGSDALDSIGQYPLVVGNDKDHVATRTAYHLDTRGPATAVSSACSTSLVAVHLACQSLLSGECDIALAGASAVAFPQRRGYHYVEGGILSPDGHCRPFSADAAGTVPGSGVAAVVLKRLADAERDGDPIRAVICATAVGNDGSQKMSYAAPAVHGQAAVIAEALSLSGLSPADISYVEAHGTGTPLGDPIEVAGLMTAMPRSADPADRCWLGSVKGNIGHLDVAAGLAGLIKTVLALEAQAIPASLHAAPVNPALRLDTGRFAVAVETVDWPRTARPRYAGVSSFGLGGTNAHLILAEAPAPARPRPVGAAQPRILPLSAGSHAALAELRTRLARHLARDAAVDVDALAATLQARPQWGVRHAVVATTLDEVRAELAADAGRVASASPRVAFCFTGAARYPAEAVRQLLVEPAFRAAYDEVAAAFAATGHPLLGPDEAAGVDEDRLERPTVSLPLLFALQSATVALLRAHGVTPAAIGGHSVGEYAAACAAGVLTVPQAARMIRRRSELFEAAPPGRMVSVDVGPDEAERLARDFDVCVAVVNSAGNCVLSGEEKPIERLADHLSATGVRARRVRVATAAHSRQVDDAAARLTEFARDLTVAEPTVAYFSATTGRPVRPGEVTQPSYWGRHMRETVRFADMARAMCEGADVVLEIGPAGTLTPYLRADALVDPEAVHSCVPHHRDPTPAVETFVRLLGRLWEHGVPVRRPVAAPAGGRRPALPPTPFSGEEHVLPAAAPAPAPTARTGSIAYAPRWERQPDPVRPVAPATGTWVVLDDGSPLAARTAEVLAGRGARVRRVGLDEETDWRTALPAADLSGVVYFWASATAHPADGRPHPERDRVELAFARPMEVAVELGAREPRGATGPLRLVAVLRDLADVTGAERADAHAALAVGPVVVAGREYAHLSTLVLDVPADAGPETAEAVVAELLCADGDAADREEVVALRGRHRWLRRWHPVPLPAAGEADLDGAVLITGGFGGIGLAVAEEMVARGVRHVALLGRRGMPDSAPVRAAVERMRAQGAQVLPLAADVADETALRQAVERAGTLGAPLRTVVHAAGVPAGGLMSLRRRDDWAAVLAPKVHGTPALARALRGVPVRQVLLCSALDAVLGTLGQVDHAAANAFLDVVPRADWFGDARVTTVDWGAWREVGQAADLGRMGALADWRRSMLEHALHPREAAPAALSALAAGWPVLAVTAADPALLLRQARATDVVSLTSASPEPTPTTRRRRPLPAHTYRAPDDPVSVAVAGIWADVLGLAEVGVDDDYFALGGNSLLAMQLVARLRRIFSFPMPLSAIIERPTVDAQAHWLRESLETYLDSLSDEEVERQLAALDAAAGPARDEPRTA
ncbi:SDR family NAD(P)-dependent oxidoreductase [Micromonospora sp. URMC 107]|uniref:type I polyketide synthase n=1 Tax=Micromonospora sp. URMC 107 TaxID=3423418 RepID=UPI003F1C184F